MSFSFTEQIDREYQRAMATPEQEAKEERIYGCHHRDCDAGLDETKPCEICADNFAESIFTVACARSAS